MPRLVPLSGCLGTCWGKSWGQCPKPSGTCFVLGAKERPLVGPLMPALCQLLALPVSPKDTPLTLVHSGCQPLLSGNPVCSKFPSGSHSLHRERVRCRLREVPVEIRAGKRALHPSSSTKNWCVKHSQATQPCSRPRRRAEC